MRVERDASLGVLMIESLGNFALGTLTITSVGDRINVVEKGSSVKILGPLPYALLKDAQGVSFVSADAALRYLEIASAPRPEFLGAANYAPGSISETLDALIENKVEKIDVDLNYKALFRSALGS